MHRESSSVAWRNMAVHVLCLSQLLCVLCTTLAPSYVMADGCRADEVQVDEDDEYVYCSKRNLVALQNAHAVRNATSRGTTPPFQPLWDFYQYNRDVAKGLAPEQNRCAIVMSMTLGLEPRPGEKTLRELGSGEGLSSIFAEIRNKMVIPAVAKSEIAKRYYVQAQELANRLEREWGKPSVIDGAKAREFISGKKGVIFLQNAYPRARGRTGDHIDVWNGSRIGSDSTTPFENAEKVWLWEIRDQDVTIPQPPAGLSVR